MSCPSNSASTRAHDAKGGGHEGRKSGPPKGCKAVEAMQPLLPGDKAEGQKSNGGTILGTSLGFQYPMRANLTPNNKASKPLPWHNVGVMLHHLKKQMHIGACGNIRMISASDLSLAFTIRALFCQTTPEHVGRGGRAESSQT